MTNIDVKRKVLPEFMIPGGITALLLLIIFFVTLPLSLALYMLAAMLIFLGITYAAYKTTCPHCNRAFAKTSTGSEELSRRKEYVRKTFIDRVRNAYGEIVQTIERVRVVPAYCVTTRKHFACKKCQHIWSKDFTKKELPAFADDEDEHVHYQSRSARDLKESLGPPPDLNKFFWG
jgi:hypothetical protein